MSYYGDFSFYYDELMDDVDYEHWYLYIEEIFNELKVKPNDILEMACGTGSLTYYLCKNGYNVTCFDKSTEMLSVAYNKLISFRNIKILNQDMTSFSINKKFDCVISICDSINYIIDEDNLLKVFKNVNEHLKKDGLFIFDINSFYKLSNIIGNNTFVEDRENIFYVWQNYFDDEYNLSHFMLSFFLNEDDNQYSRFDEEHLERAYSIEEIEKMLNMAGFKFVTCNEAFTFNDPKENSERINFIAKK